MRSRSGFRLRALTTVAALALFSSAAHALVEPQWLDVDVNRDGKMDRVAVSNLADIAFNDKGEVIGWYVKLIKGTDYGKNYDGKQNLIPSYRPKQGQPETTPSPNAAITGLTGTVTTQTPQVSLERATNGEVSFMVANFKYSQGAATVQKTYRIQPRRLTIDLELTVNGVPTYPLEFVGLGAATPQPKALEKGASMPLNAGEVKDFQYASLQCCNNVLGNPGEAIIVRPGDGLGAVRASVGIRDENVVTERGAEKLQRAFVTLTMPGNTTSKLRVYGGFNELVRFDVEGHYGQLPGLFEPNIFGQLSLLLIQFLRSLYNALGSWGLAIVALTVILRVLMWPLMTAQLKSSAEMQAIQPEMVKLRAKYKDNPAKLQEETIAMYKEHGINPAAGCLPIFLQMPVLIVLWRVVANFEFDQGFLWLRDLSLPDTIPNGLFILPVLYVAVNVLQTWFYTRAQPEMFRTQLIIQLVFVYLVLSFPSGVTLYWVLSTIIQVGQQWLINRQVQARMAGTALGAMAAANKAAATTTPAKPKDAGKKASSKK